MLVDALLLVIQQILVPLVLLGVLVRSALVARAQHSPEARRAGRAGFLSGLALALVGVPLVPLIPDVTPSATSHLLAVLLAVTGAGVLWAQARLGPDSPATAVGCLCFLTVFGAVALLVLVFSTASLRGPIATLTLTTLVVVFGIVAAFPGRLQGSDRPPVVYR